jgi:hypothetical protein
MLCTGYLKILAETLVQKPQIDEQNITEQLRLSYIEMCFIKNNRFF